MRLFVYGTLKDRPTVKRVLKHAVTETMTTLKDYRLLDHQEWPTLEPEAGAEVVGDIFNVDRDDLHKLDLWENHYKRHLVDTASGIAWVYLRK